ncbi:TIM barrel protein [Paracoccus rhizosphaerae]|uniref:TIM barrel protein n=1 Tax=Paracoccus rhizosphaerae TaxID=1133347 RepID=A0ABV6CIH7_9RHOB|nr:TIM barrel protein [Paracoccus rhizosphaerae]
MKQNSTREQMPLGPQNIAAMNFHYVRYSLERFLADACESGVSRIELWGAAPHFFTEDRTLAEARELGRRIRGMGMELIAFTPEQCQYPINISSTDSRMRNRSIQYFMNCMEFAVELNAPALLVTAGGGDRDEPAELAMARCTDAMGLLCDRAGTLGVDLWMEVLPPAWSNIICNAQQMGAFFDQIASPSLHGVYDVAGAVMTGETAQDYFHHLRDRLAHIHMTDSDAQGSHMAWGEGIVDLNTLVSFLRIQNYQGSMSIELTNWVYNLSPAPPLRKCVAALQQALA